MASLSGAITGNNKPGLDVLPDSYKFKMCFGKARPVCERCNSMHYMNDVYYMPIYPHICV